MTNSTNPLDRAALEAKVVRLTGIVDSQRMRLEGVHRIGRALSATLDLDKLLDLIMSEVTQLMDAERSTLFLVDEEKRELWSRVAQAHDVETIKIPLGVGIAGWVAQEGQTVNIKDCYKDTRFNKQVDLNSGFRTTSMLCQPLRNHRGKIIGVIQVLNKRQGYFTMEDDELLAGLGAQAAISIENSKLFLDVVGKNITLLHTQNQLKKRRDELDLLFRIEQELNRSHQIHTFLASLLKASCSAMWAEAGAMVIRHGDAWEALTWRDGKTSKRLLTAEDPEGDALRVAGTGVDLLRSRSEGVDDAVLEEMLGRKLESCVGVALELGGERFGAILLLNRVSNEVARREERSPAFSSDDLRTLTMVAGRAEAALVLSRQRAEAMKANSLAAIGQALSGVLHDLKTPMTIIGGYAQLMVDEDDPEERQDYAQLVDTQMVNLKGMTTEILSFARGESSLLVRKIFLHQLLPELMKELSQEMAGTGIKTTLDMDYRDDIRIDVGKMKRVMFNLARNAWQAMEAHGGSSFTISSMMADDVVELRFTDDGPGIPEEIRHNLFDSFVTCGKEDGTGLGLAIVKKIVEQHDGTIHFETAEGEGTTFVVRIPRIPRSDG